MIFIFFSFKAVDEDVWTAWTAWTDCSVTCGDGEQNRLRECQGSNCGGSSEETRTCNIEDCQGNVSYGYHIVHL